MPLTVGSLNLSHTFHPFAIGEMPRKYTYSIYTYILIGSTNSDCAVTNPQHKPHRLLNAVEYKEE